MGNSQSTPLNQQLQHYDLIKTDKELNITHLKKHSNRKEYALKQTIHNDQKLFAKTLKLYQLRSSLHNEHLTHLEKYEQKQTDSLCSAMFKIYSLWEHPTRTLEEEIIERRSQNRKFNQKQLLSLSASCILALSQLQKNNIFHQHLRSSTILLAEDGMVKIMDPLLVTSLTNFSLLKEKNQNLQKLYLSPEQCSAMQSHAYCMKSFKSDVWVLGMILMECALLNTQQQCYKDQYQRVNWVQIENNINQIQLEYGKDVKDLIKYMLMKSKRDRPDWQQLQTFILKEKNKQSQPIPQLSYPTHLHQQTQSKLSPNQFKFTYLPTQPIAKQENPPRPPSQPQQINPLPVQEITFRKEKIQPIKQFKQKQNQLKFQSFQITDTKHRSVEKSNPDGLKGYISSPSNDYLFAKPYLVPIIESQHITEIREDKRAKDTSFQRKKSPTLPAEVKGAQSITYEIGRNSKEPKENQENEEKIMKESVWSLPENIDDDSEFVVEEFKQGSKYEGYKLHGKRHGRGKFYYQDGGMYDGNWVQNKMDGYGSLYYESGKVAYEGQWKNDQFHGRGKLYNQHSNLLSQMFNFCNFDEVDEYWQFYEGQFFQDLKHGRGKFMLSNGEYYLGEFEFDSINGQGKFYRKNGSIVKGVWNDNCLISQKF